MRRATDEQLAEADDELSAPPGGRTEGMGDRKFCYRLGPRARAVIGAPAVLSLIEALAGAAWGLDEIAANLDTEFVGVDAAAENKEVKLALEGKMAAVASRKAARIAKIEGGAGGGGGGGGGGGDKPKRKK